MRPPWKVIALLATVWIVAWLVIVWSRSAQPTPESLEAYIYRHHLDTVSASERARIIDHAADQLNRLTFEQREKLRQNGSEQEFFQQMTPEERSHFMDLTLPQGFHELIMALNKMEPEKRRELVSNALAQMRKSDPPQQRQIDDAQAQKVVSQGMESFYKDSSPEVKLDFAPLIEQIQQTTQGPR